VLFYSDGVLYLFDKKTIYFTSPVAMIGYEQYRDVPCLLDMDLTGNQAIPSRLINSGLFLLQATSPNPKNTEWTKQRDAVTFVLNPPGEHEIINVSVFCSLYLHP
jgi:hypothetical protein